MSWLDANEYFLMDIVARERVEDLRSTIDVERPVRIRAPHPSIAARPRCAAPPTTRSSSWCWPAAGFGEADAPPGTREGSW